MPLSRSHAVTVIRNMNRGKEEQHNVVTGLD